MDSRLSRWLDGLLEACWLAALVIAPIYFNIQSDRVFEPDKIALLRSLAVVMAAAWLVKFIDRRSWQNLGQLDPRRADSYWRRPFVLVVGLLVLVYLVSTAFSVTPRVSLLGSYQRLQGTYSTFSYLVIFAMIASTIRTREQVQRVVTVIIISSIPVAFYGLLQHFDLDPLPWGGDVTDRVAGHLGNAIFIAAFLIMVVPLTLARIVDAFSNILGDENLSLSDVVRSSVYIFILALQLITIYWSGSRGPLLGLLVGLFAFMLVLLVSLRDTALARAAGQVSRGREILPAFLFLIPSIVALFLAGPISQATSPFTAFTVFFGVVALSVLVLFVMVAAGRGWRWLWLGWILLALFVGGWLVMFNLAPATAADWPVVGSVFSVQEQWRELPTIGSFGKMLDATATAGREKSGRVRVLIWEGVLDLVTPHTPLTYPDGTVDRFNFLRPLIGYGPESMYVAYNRFYPPELATVEARNASPDRSHNETFDALVITGLLGFLVWQAVYLSVVYFAFRYLGVVRSKRDRFVLIGLMAGGGLLAALLAIAAADSIYLGVAVPTGIIAGIILYLIYYALFGQHEANDAVTSATPFHVDRLLMNALVAGVLAHYVEIHFGIAIGSTRLLFFTFAALMIGLSMQSKEEEMPAEALAAAAAPPPKTTTGARAATSKRKGRATSAPATPTATGQNLWHRLVFIALFMTFIVGLIGITFVTYALPPGKTITGPADLAVGEIFRQSLLQNVKRDFVDSPYIFVMIAMTWALGWVIFLSEMAKDGQLRVWKTQAERLLAQRKQLAGGLLALMAAAGVAMRFVPALGVSSPLGGSLALGWALLCAGGAVWLLTGRPGAQTAGGAVALMGLAAVPPVLIAGGFVPGLVLAVLSGALLFLVWDPRWRSTLVPTAALAAGSMLAGALAVYLYSSRYKSALFFQAPSGVTSTAQLRGLEAAGSSGLLSIVYIFVFLVVLLMSVALAWPALTGRRNVPFATWTPAIVAAVILLPMAFWLLAQTNLRVIQADMIFKRGRPYDDQASSTSLSDPTTAAAQFDNAISVYNQAISRVPTEDFYYLFLGRSLLERSTLAKDATAKTEFLTEAETRLIEAQSINPLNTDHTANLARLNTRWYGATTDPAEQQKRLGLAEEYYQKALTLSPQNSIVRNEYGRLLLEVKNDCDGALKVYDDSVNIDPFYAQSFLARADAYVRCGSTLSEADRNEYYGIAAASVQKALDLAPDNIRGWAQLTELYRQMGENDLALQALEQARLHNQDGRFPEPQMDFLEAQIRAAMGETDAARALAEGALSSANEEFAAQIQAFLDGLGQTAP